MRTRGPLVVVAAVLPGRLSKTRHATAVLKHLPTAVRDGYISGFTQVPLPGEHPGRSP